MSVGGGQSFARCSQVVRDQCMRPAFDAPRAIVTPHSLAASSASLSRLSAKIARELGNRPSCSHATYTPLPSPPAPPRPLSLSPLLSLSLPPSLPLSSFLRVFVFACVCVYAECRYERSFGLSTPTVYRLMFVCVQLIGCWVKQLSSACSYLHTVSVT